jgi:hypothetical protein
MLDELTAGRALRTCPFPAGDAQGSVRCLPACFTARFRFATIRYMAGTQRMSAAGGSTTAVVARP